MYTHIYTDRYTDMYVCICVRVRMYTYILPQVNTHDTYTHTHPCHIEMSTLVLLSPPPPRAATMSPLLGSSASTLITSQVSVGGLRVSLSPSLFLSNPFSFFLGLSQVLCVFLSASPTMSRSLSVSLSLSPLFSLDPHTYIILIYCHPIAVIRTYRCASYTSFFTTCTKKYTHTPTRTHPHTCVYICAHAHTHRHRRRHTHIHRVHSLDNYLLQDMCTHLVTLTLHLHSSEQLSIYSPTIQ